MKVGKIFGYTLFAGILTLPLMVVHYFPVGFFYLPIALSIGLGAIAARHFIKHLHQPLEYRYSSDPYPLYIGPLLVAITTLIFSLNSGWFWIIPHIILTACQLWFWQKYPFLPRKFSSNRQWIEPLAKAVGALAFGNLVWVLLIAVLNAWHLGHLLPVQWAAIAALGLLTVPMSMALAMLPKMRWKPRPKAPIRKGTSLADQIKYLDWQNIPISLNILERTEGESGYHLLPSYDLALSRFPRAWYPFSKKEVEGIQQLDNLIQTKMDDLLAQNAPFQLQPEQCWCDRHHSRATVVHHGNFAVTLCRICKTDRHLRHSVAKAIGAMGEGKPLTDNQSEWHFPTWNASANTFIPGDYDEIWMLEGNSINPDWYVTAMMAWLDNHFSVTEKTIPVQIQRGIPLGENARKLLEVAAEEGKIGLKWVG